MVYPYRFVDRFDNIGIGVEDMGFTQPTTLPVDSIYAARYNVQMTLAPQAPGYLKQQQNLVPVGLRANGVYMSGELALQALVEFERAGQ